jgi:hypothetical protein
LEPDDGFAGAERAPLPAFGDWIPPDEPAPPAPTRGWLGDELDDLPPMDEFGALRVSL